MSSGTIWITGLSGSGKSTLAAEVECRLRALDVSVWVLDGDVLREGLNADLGFSREDRGENVRRVGELALLLAARGYVVVAPLISPYRDDRDLVRGRHIANGVPFLEVYLDVPLEECERRDPKGLYARARAGALQHLTGVDDPYEPPAAPDVRIEPGATPADDADRVVAIWGRVAR